MKKHKSIFKEKLMNRKISFFNMENALIFDFEKRLEKECINRNDMISS